MLTRKRSSSVYVFCFFTVLCSILNLSTAICNCIAWYEIFRKGRDRRLYLIWGRNFSEWQTVGDRIYAIHSLLCLLFVLIFGILFVVKKFKADNYIWAILGFYVIQFLIAILFMYLFDPEKISCALKNLFYIRYKYLRWVWSLGCLLLGLLLKKSGKNIECQ